MTSRNAYYLLQTLHGHWITMTDISLFLFTEKEEHPFIQPMALTKDVDVRLPELVAVYACDHTGRFEIAGRTAEKTREQYARRLQDHFRDTFVLFPEEVSLTDDTAAAHLLAYAYVEGALYAYSDIDCVTTEEIDNLYGIRPDPVLSKLRKTSAFPFGPRREGDEVVQIPDGTYEEVEADLRVYLAATPGLTVLYPTKGTDVEPGRNYGVIVEEGVDLSEVLAAYSHPIVDALRLSLPTMVWKAEGEKMSIG